MSTSSLPAPANSPDEANKGHQTTSTTGDPSSCPHSDTTKAAISDTSSSDKLKKVKLDQDKDIDANVTEDAKLAVKTAPHKASLVADSVTGVSSNIGDDDVKILTPPTPIVGDSSPSPLIISGFNKPVLLKNNAQQDGKPSLTNLNIKSKIGHNQPTKANILSSSTTKVPAPTNKIFLTDHTIIKTSNLFNSCTTAINTTTNNITTNTKPLVINHSSTSTVSGMDKIVNHQNEIQSIIPTLSSQLIFSSIIATKTPRNNVVAQISKSQSAGTSTAITTITNSPTATAAIASTVKMTPTKPALVDAASTNGGLSSPSSRINKSNHTKQSNSGATSPSAIVLNGHAVTGKLMDMGKRLLDAARDGLTDQVRQLVVNSGAPFTSDWLGTTALHLAAQYGHAEIADILLKGGVNRDARTKLERTALHLAAQVGCLEVVDLLLIHGSDVNARDMLKMTPLHWAVERCHTSVVERLLLSGADVSAKSKFQLTPIDIAQTSNSFEILELFKTWTNCSDILDNLDNQIATGKKANPSDLDYSFNESHDVLDVDYQLALDVDNHINASSRTPTLDIDEPCIDLVELEWNTLKFEPDFFLSNDDDEDEEEDELDLDDEEPKVEYLKKVVEELTKENRQLRQRVEQLSTSQ